MAKRLATILGFLVIPLAAQVPFAAAKIGETDAGGDDAGPTRLRRMDETLYSVDVSLAKESDERVHSARPARIGYLVVASGDQEAHKAKMLIEAIYHPRNFYLVHLDRKTESGAREEFEAYIENWENVRMLEPALAVTYAGVTQLLSSIFGISTLLRWSDEWDFFINLSASDFPLLRQEEIMWLLGQHADAGMNFMSTEPVTRGSQHFHRLKKVAEDESLHREDPMPEVGLRWIDSSRRPPSQSMFTVYKGEYWVILHRSFCKYGNDTPDNIARSLQIYFGSFWDPTESYFQTLACHPMAPDFPTHSDCMRYIDWRKPAGQHPNLIIDATEALQSGALFARKFDLEKSQQAYAAVRQTLATRDPERVLRALKRMSAASATEGREAFCERP